MKMGRFNEQAMSPNAAHEDVGKRKQWGTLLSLLHQSHSVKVPLYWKKWAITGLFLFIFGLFKQTIQFLQQINVKKYHVHVVYRAGIWTHDLSNVIQLP